MLIVASKKVALSGLGRMLSLPNEDFGRFDNRRNPDFEGSPFQGREYSIWATNH